MHPAMMALIMGKSGNGMLSAFIVTAMLARQTSANERLIVKAESSALAIGTQLVFYRCKSDLAPIHLAHSRVFLISAGIFRRYYAGFADNERTYHLLEKRII